MKKKLLIIIMVIGFAVSAGLFTACGEKIDNGANYDAARAALEAEGFAINDFTDGGIESLIYDGAVKGFTAYRLSTDLDESVTYESVTVHLLPDQKTLDTFVKIWSAKSAEGYTRGLIFYRGGDPMLAFHKSAAHIVLKAIGGDKTA